MRPKTERPAPERRASLSAWRSALTCTTHGMERVQIAKYYNRIRIRERQAQAEACAGVHADGSFLGIAKWLFFAVIWIVLDSVAFGALPDAADYDDVGRSTLGHCRIAPCRFELVKLGLRTSSHSPLPAGARPIGALEKADHSPGRYDDGHWEMAGVWLIRRFCLQARLPAELIADLSGGSARTIATSQRRAQNHQNSVKSMLKTGKRLCILRDSVFRLRRTKRLFRSRNCTGCAKLRGSCWTAASRWR